HLRQSHPLVTLLVTVRPPTTTLFPYTTLFRSFVIALHALTAVVVPPLVRVLGPRVFLVAALPLGTTAAWTLVRTPGILRGRPVEDRKSTRLNSSHVKISYAVFCLKKKKETKRR